MQKIGLFMAAMLYGASWFVGAVNILAAVLAVQEGNSPLSYIPLILLPFGIILYVHHLAGWFPFRRA